jgi:quercetin 2,3-dioxygenase
MEAEAKIFLSEERGLTEATWMRSYNTFNFGHYKTKYKTAVDSLYVLNDDTLAAEKNMRMKVEEDSLLLLLPLAGATAYKDSNGNENLVTAGQLLTTGLKGKDHFTLSNPYPNALVNYLQVWIKAVHIHASTMAVEQSFDIDGNKNSFEEKRLANGITLHIGKFSGRQKIILDSKHTNSTCFAFVIEGAFELEERLLHARDGLALWQVSRMDMEALSNDAIIMLIEMAA